MIRKLVVYPIFCQRCLPSHCSLIVPFIYYLDIDSEPGKVAREHQPGRPGSDDTYLARLWGCTW